MKKLDYNHAKIEKKWQNTWKLKKIYKTGKESGRKCYVLDMFPYPSGAGLHVGHPRGYIASDVFARMRRMQGYNVLHPMGFDSFGLPAEQYAIKTGKHPGPFTDELVKKYIKQLEIIGFSYDWSRMVETHDPKYYKWTQWIFLQIYNSYFDTKSNKAKPISDLIKLFERKGNAKVNAFCDPETKIFSPKEWKAFSEIEKQNILMKYRLAYEGQAEVNWCAELGTVLANDEVIDGPNGELLSERGEHPVEKRMMRQWMMRITAYAERLLSGLEKLDWADGLKETQKNWIGKEILKNGDVTYKMRDAIFARQRYWGEPIPLIHKKDGAITTIPESKLPLKLPSVKSYKPSGTGESPLASVKAWTDKGYETNTMPGWAGSSWYFLRYMDPSNNKRFASEKAVKYWGQVDMYVGGVEHASGHLFYSRFWNKVLKDLGHVYHEEPFATLKNQGFIIAEDGRKMSKRWGNVINPDEIVKTYGADTLRVYEMFMGPFNQLIAWNTESMMGSRRFIEKVWRINNEFVSLQTHKDVSKLLHKTIKKVTEDIENFSFNTAISSMMIFLNEITKEKPISKSDYKMFLQILAPFAPHVAEELWSILGEKKSINLSAWPKYNKSQVKETEFEIPVQVNGKVRTVLRIPAGMNENQIKKLALADGNIQKHVDKEIKKVIYIPNKIINIVL